MPGEYQSPVLIHHYRNGDKKHLVEVEHAQTGRILASCMIGDDEGMERLADLLSAKKLPREAMAIRNLMREARKVRA